MGFRNSAADAVLADYAARIEREAPPGSNPVGDRDTMLLPIGPQTGWFLHSLILAKRPARILELGTSYGYSTLFLAEAAQQTGGKVISVDVADYKQAYARDMLARAGLDGVVEFRRGDALAIIEADEAPFDLVLLDIWKELYVPCLAALHPRLADEGIIAADNMIEPADVRVQARAYRAAVHALPDMQSMLLPVGSGIELSIKWAAGNGKL